MKKNEKAAISAVLAYLDLENETTGLMKMKKKAYENFFSGENRIWNENGVRNIFTGRKILDAKRKTGIN
jgi:hypothetical protein